MYESALLFATEKHKNQVRKFNGEPYVTHPIRVANTVKEFTSDERIIVTALLHDTIEDTDATREEIETNFGVEVANMVCALSNDKVELKRLGKTAYLTEKMNSLSDSELLVKLADRLDNIRDLSHDNETWSMQYMLQTDAIITCLKNPNITDHHQTLILRIKSIILNFIKTDL